MKTHLLLGGSGAAVAALSCCAGVNAAPLKVYILAGQSNMQGHAHVRTFEHIGMDPATAPLLAKMVNVDGTPRVLDRVWISAIGCSEEEKSGKLTAGFGAEARGPKIGPEFTFGIAMAERVREPILLIKTAWGGKSLHTDFRPPSAGPYEFNAAQLEQLAKQGKDLAQAKAGKAAATGAHYRLMLEHVKKVLGDIQRVVPDYDPKQGYELAGFVWFQGWNDMTDSGVYPNRGRPGGYDLYSTLLAHFIRDVRKDFSAPKLPFVIGVMGVGGDLDAQPPTRYTPIHRSFREAQAAVAQMPEFQDNVFAVLTEKCWDPQLSALRARGEQITDEEIEILRKGVSNAEFHYLGSAKIMARIGVAFAEVLAGEQGAK